MAAGGKPSMPCVCKIWFVTEAKKFNTVQVHCAHRPSSVSRLSRRPACWPASLPRLESTCHSSALCGSTWLGPGSAHCLGSGLQVRPALAPAITGGEKVHPRPGPAPKVVVSRRRNDNHGVTEAKQFKKYGDEKVQQRCGTSAGIGLAGLGPARPGPA